MSRYQSDSIHMPYAVFGMEGAANADQRVDNESLRWGGAQYILINVIVFIEVESGECFGVMLLPSVIDLYYLMLNSNSALHTRLWNCVLFLSAELSITYFLPLCYLY